MTYPSPTQDQVATYVASYPQYTPESVEATLNAILLDVPVFDAATVDYYIRNEDDGGLGFGVLVATP